MNDFQFEQSPWEAYLNSCKQGSSISAWNLISMLEGEDDAAVEDAFSILAARQLTLDLSTLPQPESGSRTARRLKQEAEYVQAGLATEKMEEGDPLRLYLEEIAGLPGFGDEHLLAESLLAGDDAAARQLADLGLSRVCRLS